MKMQCVRLIYLLCLLPWLLLGQAGTGPTVRFSTNLGNIDVLLLPESAPRTVENFLNYVNRGAYNNSFIHRSVPSFVIQGGGYRFENNSAAEIPADPPVVNEFRIPNTRGTIAMAKLGDNPNSATSQWFFNLGDNRSNLDNQNGGFTVFGRVANTASQSVIDRIAATPVPGGFNSPFDALPLIGYSAGSPIQQRNLVFISTVALLQTTPTPSISSNGVVGASAFGGRAQTAPGGWIEIYGQNLAAAMREWGTGDFNNGAAPTTLENVSVTIGGQAAYVSFVSPTQVNVQVPSNAPTGDAVEVVVKRGTESSPSAPIRVSTVAPSLLSPAMFKVGDNQYVAALHTSNQTYVSNGDIPNVTAAPAVPGETITIYGVGFGPVTPSSPGYAGQVSQGQTIISTPIEFYIGDNRAQLQYSGLAPSSVGLYQFNVIVPPNAPDGNLPIRIVLGSENLAQTLLLPVKK
jgi:uncharacterized protein (TIGR03437 family)